jgi:hypothetical protein
LRGEGIADHVADVVGDESCAADLQPVQHLRDVVRLRCLVVAAGRMRREPHAAQIGRDNGVIFDQRRRDRRPHVAGVAETVQQDDRGSLAAVAHMDRRAAGFDIAGLETSRERPSFRRN